MSAMAASLEEADRVDIAAWFSSQEREPERMRLSSARGRALFLDGDVERGIPQCASCHGERAQGGASRGVTYPMLARQHRTYLRIQLVRWRLGERSNSPDAVMNRVARLLDDDDIDVLAEHLSGL
jgi:cytochrome c553